MNGPHDLGGAHGFGPVRAETGEPPFHGAWERRAFACTLAMGAARRWTLDESRFARESIRPDRYLSSSYYEIWLLALEELLLAKGLLSRAELQAGRSAGPGLPVARLAGAEVAAMLARGGPTGRPPQEPGPRYAIGMQVRTRSMNPAGHTRLPRYARGKQGTVIGLHGRHVFPDTNAAGAGEQPQWLYTVRFDGAELWGAGYTTASSVCIDCWEPYLE